MKDRADKVENSRTRRRFVRDASALALGGSCGANLLAAVGPRDSLKTPPGPPTQEAAARPPSQIEIGILLATFVRPPLELRLDSAKAHGLQHIQLSLDCVGLAAMPDEIGPGIADRIRRETSARGITVASIQGTFNMCHPDSAHRAAGLRRLRVLAQLCQELSVPRIHICSGTRNRESMWRPHADNATPSAWKDMAGCLREAADIARQAGVVLGVEPEVNNVVDSALKARRLMDEIGSPHLKVTIDAANLFHAGELARMAEILDEAFALVGRDVVMVHAKDLDRDGDAGHKAAGEGKLDYDRYLSLLHAHGFRGPVFLHGLSEAQVPGCVAFVRAKLARAIAQRSGP